MRRFAVFSLVYLSVLLVPGLALPDEFIDFDNISATSNFSTAYPLRDEYASKGVHFRGPSALDGGAVLSVGNFNTPAYSDSKFLAFFPGATLANTGKAQAPEIISFDSLWQTVSIYVSGASTEDQFILEAFGPDGASVGDTKITTVGFAQLSITSARGISKVILSSGNQSDGIFVADDLALTTPVTPTPEPGTIIMLGLGLIGIGVFFMIRKK